MPSWEGPERGTGGQLCAMTSHLAALSHKASSSWGRCTQFCGNPCEGTAWSSSFSHIACTHPGLHSHPTGGYRGLITSPQAGSMRGACLPDPVLMPVMFTKPVLPEGWWCCCAGGLSVTPSCAGFTQPISLRQAFNSHLRTRERCPASEIPAHEKTSTLLVAYNYECRYLAGK